MAKDIDNYLRELQAALAGADPALVQDALFDAEEYLQAEMAASESGAPDSGDVETGPAGRGATEPSPADPAEARFAAAVESYGTPEEVAAAYLGTPATRGAATTLAAPTAVGVPPAVGAPPVIGAPPVREAPAAEQASRAVPAEVAAGTAAAAGTTAPPGVWQQIFGVVADPRVYKALLYMILSLGTGIAYFTIVVTGLSTAGGLLILVIGLPFLLLVLGIVRAMALFEGRLVELLLGTRMPRRPRAEPPGAGFVQRMWFWLKDGRTWASVAYMVLMLPLGVVYFTIAVTGLAVGLGLITSPFWAWLGDHTFVYEGVTYDWWFPAWGIPLAVIGGLLVLVAWLHVARWIGRGHAALAKAMLVRLAK